MKRRELEEAAFWDREICVDCEVVFDSEDAAEGNCCPECGSGRVVSAASALAILESVEEDTPG
jgi:predicted RNA-binding Zn-ribbon protein involved in translation (DUF1610 family)